MCSTKLFYLTEPQETKHTPNFKTLKEAFYILLYFFSFLFFLNFEFLDYLSIIFTANILMEFHDTEGLQVIISGEKSDTLHDTALN